VFILGLLISAVGQEQSFEQAKTCSEFASLIKLNTSIEDSAVIQKILARLDDNTPCVTAALQPECRAPPLAELLESF
jgi:hypothetical protein